MKEKTDERIPQREENRQRRRKKPGGKNKLIPQGMADTLRISLTVELGRKDTDAAKGAEDRQIKDKNELVDDGNAAHGHGAHLTDHYVIKQTYEICYRVLYKYRDHYHKQMLVERAIAEKFIYLHHVSLSKFFVQA